MVMACSNVSTTTLVERMLLRYLMFATVYAAHGRGSHTTVYAAQYPGSTFPQHSKYRHSGMYETHHKGGLSLVTRKSFLYIVPSVDYYTAYKRVERIYSLHDMP